MVLALLLLVWHKELGGGSQVSGKFVDPWSK
jgi:hypothetical protein